MAQLGGASSCRPKGCKLNTQSGHRVRLWVGPWLERVREATDGCFSLTLMLSSSLSPSFPLSLKSVSMCSDEDKKLIFIQLFIWLCMNVCLTDQSIVFMLRLSSAFPVLNAWHIADTPLFKRLYLFIETGKGGRKRSEKHQCEREASTGCLLHVPLPRTELATQATLHHEGWRPTNQATLVRATLNFFKWIFILNDLDKQKI